MKQKILILGLACMAYSQQTSNAATAVVLNVVDGVNDTLYQNSNGTLSSGGIVTIGYFTDGFDVGGNLNNYSLLISNFTPGIITSQLTGTFSASLGGSFAGYVEQTTPTAFGGGAITAPNDSLIGRPLYSFVGNQATLGASNELLLAFVQNIQDDVPTPNAYTSIPQNATPLIGSVGTFVGDPSGNGSGTFRTFQFAAIPEPSTLLLSALGILALLRRKR